MKIELTVEQFMKISGMTRQGIAKKIKAGKLESRKEANGRVLVIIDIDLPEQENKKILNEIKYLLTDIRDILRNKNP